MPHAENEEFEFELRHTHDYIRIVHAKCGGVAVDIRYLGLDGPAITKSELFCLSAEFARTTSWTARKAFLRLRNSNREPAIFVGPQVLIAVVPQVRSRIPMRAAPGSGSTSGLHRISRS